MEAVPRLAAAVSHHHAYANGLLMSVTECARAMALSFIRSGYDIDVDIGTAGGPSRPRQTWVLQDGFDPGDDP